MHINILHFHWIISELHIILKVLSVKCLYLFFFLYILYNPYSIYLRNYLLKSVKLMVSTII